MSNPVEPDSSRTPRVAVLILNWNGRAHLETCLPALADQTYCSFELVVIDNGSTDDSVSWLDQQQIQPCRVLRLKYNHGFAGGNAAGFRALAPDTDFVALLNNDTAPEPTWLESLVKAALVDVKRGAIASLMVDWSGRTVDSAGDGIRVTGRGYQRYHGRPRDEAPQSGLVFSACAGAALYRWAMLSEVGFLDERFFMNGEDTDLCFRARLAGWEVWYCAEAVVRHRVSASQGSGSASSVFHNERNHLWSVAKCMPTSLLWKYSWVHLLEVPARALFYARRGKLIAWMRGRIAGLSGAASFFSERRRIQSSRRVSTAAIERYFVFPVHLGGRDDESLPRV